MISFSSSYVFNFIFKLEKWKMLFFFLHVVDYSSIEQMVSVYKDK